MKIHKKIRLATEEDPLTLTAAQRTGSLNHLSPTVCTDGVLNTNCRVDVTGNASAFDWEVGNTVYNGLSGSVKFNGNNLYYNIVALLAGIGMNSYICRVNTVGVITEISTTCVLEEDI